MTSPKFAIRQVVEILSRVAVLLIVFSTAVTAQTTTKTGTDQMTPSNLAAGTPAGSYALSGFDSVSLFNGNLNFRLPLLAIGGRGSAGYTMMLSLNTKSWHVKRTSMTNNGEETVTYTPTPNTWQQPNLVGYGPGFMIGRQSGEGTIYPVISPCNTQHPLYEKTITRLTFTGSDGTEFEFVDQQTMGKPYATQHTDCSNPGGGFSRGRVFVTTKGEAATFISDTAISDINQTQPSGNRQFNPSGFMFLREGTRYRIDNGLVSWIQDRNGNKVTFNSYDANQRILRVTDSLNRQVNISYDTSSPTDCSVHYDVITFTGFGGTTRTIQVGHNCLGNALRSDQSLMHYTQLFPELGGSGNITPQTFNDKVITGVTLPDGRQYQFFYNTYAELARVVLPTGGAYEYDYTTTSGVGDDNVTGVDKEIYRRVIERRVMPDGTNIEGRTRYSPATGVGGLATVDHLDGTGHVLLAHDEHTFHTSGAPLQDGTTPNVILYADVMDGMEDHVDAMDTDGTTGLRQELNSYSEDTVPWMDNGFQWYINPQLRDTLSKLLDMSPALVSERHMDYDQYNNLASVKEYDFGSNGQPGALLRQTTTSYVVTNGGVNYAAVDPNNNASATMHLRSLPLQQSVFDGPTGVEKARTVYEYDHYNQTTSEDFHASLTSRSNITGLDSSSTTSYYTRGNVTKTTRAVSFDSSGNVSTSVSGYAQYDIAGNVVKTVDPRSTPTNIIATTYDFSDAYGHPDGNAEGNETPLPPELNTNPPFATFAFATKVTNALNQNAFIQYDYYLGKPVNSEDANGTVSSGRYGGFADGSYIDLLDRPTEVIVAANVSSLSRRTRFTYTDSSHLITTQSDQTTLNDGVLTSTIVYDGLGRTTETRTSAPESTIYTTQQFDAMGRVKRGYNPYRTTSDPTYGYTETAYDALGRVLTVKTFDGSGNSTGVVTTSYSGNTTTVTDQAGNKRRSIIDGLGRLIRVDEPDSSGNLDSGTPPQPVQPTSYLYDALGNLIQVNQGSQQRLFTYDSLSRLKTAKNPEQVSGSTPIATTYDYDDASNLLTRTNPDSSTVGFSYDGLNRVKSKTLTKAGSSTVWNYQYDTLGSALNGIGRLTSIVLQNSSDGYYYDGYDGMGRVTSSRQITTAGTANSYSMSYEYDLAGNMKREVYPSGKAFITEFDSAGRIAGVKKEGANYYAGATPTDGTNRILYSAHGAVSAMKLGNGKWERTLFNARLQPTEIDLGASNGASDLLKLEYKYGVLVNNTLDTTQNNGNIQSQIITASALTLTQTYGYDQLNRLSNATESGGTNEWSQTYSYDQYGNRAVTVGTVLDAPRTPQTLSAFDTATNRIKPSVMSGFGYDNSGNVTSDPNASVIGYDAENHQTSYGASTYSYDGDGRRVKKQVGSTTTVFVYNVAGQLIAEYDNSTSPPPGSGTSYLISDQLGSTRAVMKSDGTVARHDYLPFGEEISSSVGGRSSVVGYSAADDTRQKFTQKERDTESGLDYFGARYYSSAQGRFTGVDPLDPVLGKQGAESKDEEKANRAFLDYLSKPSHWNRYIYALDNPLRYIDADGLQETIVVGVQIVWDKNTKYTDKEKQEIKRTYLNEANKGLNKLGITLVVVAERDGAATNLDNKNRSIEGHSENSVNIFFTKNNSLPSTEVTRYDQGSIFIQTHMQNFVSPGESPTDSDLALHGSLHAFGLSEAKTGSYDAAERMVLVTMEYLQKGDKAFSAYEDDAAHRSMMPSVTKILRDGARKYAVGGKTP